MAEKGKGPNKDEINVIKKYIEELNVLYSKLEGTNPFKGMDAKKIASSVDEVKKLKNTLQEARDAVSNMEGEAGDLFKSWKAISDEVKGYRKVINNSKDTVSKINDLTQKLYDHQNKTNRLSSKDLNSLKSKLEQQKSILKGNKESLETTIEELQAKKRSGNITATELSQLRTAESIQNNINEGLKEEDGLLNSIINKTEEEAKERKKIEKSLGVTGGLLKGISQIPFLKDTVDTEKVLEAANDKIENTGSALKGLGAGFKEIGSQIKKGMLSPANLAVGAITQLGIALKESDSAAGDLAKSMNITYDQALGVRRELGNMAAMSMDVAINTKGLQETLVAVNSALGTNGKIAKEDLITFTKLREQAGMTNEEILGMQKYSMATGGSLEDNVKSFQASAKIMSYQKGVALNTKKLMTEMTNVSNRTKLSIQGGADGLAKAAVAAKLMGGNLEQAASMADSLLQFESSIENELSAELLLGKDINLEKARQAALNNDLATVAEEVTKQVGSAAEFSKMNRIQQEAAAKAVGMSADQLADMLVEQEALKSVGKALNDEEKAAFETAKQKYGAEKAAQMLKDGQLDSMVEQQSMQERFNQSVEKLQDIFMQLAEPILSIVSPLADLVSSVLPAINVIMQPIVFAFQAISTAFKTVFDLITGSIPALTTFGVVLTGILATQQAIAFQKKQGWLYDTYTFAINQKNAIIEGVINAKKMIGTAIEKKGLILGIAEAAMGAFKSMTAIPIIGPVLGAAAAAAAVGLGYSLMKGNDVFSPAPGGQGYGKRTLMGPEGAIQLNDKDTVIAGTNLFDKPSKGDDVMSAPKGAIKVANSTAPKKEVKEDPNAGINSRLDALIATTGKVNSVSTLKIQ